MCGGTAGDIIKGAQKEADKAIKGVQAAADSAVNQATGNTGGSSGGKGAPVTAPVFNMPSFGGIGGGFKVPEINIPTPNLGVCGRAGHPVTAGSNQHRHKDSGNSGAGW
jgi:hypothetical protein